MSSLNLGQSSSREQGNSEMQQARAHRDAIRERLHEHEQRYNRYHRELDEKRHLLAYATPEDDALEIAKASAMIPVYEQSIARLRPAIRDAQQELAVAERTLHLLAEQSNHRL